MIANIFKSGFGIAALAVMAQSQTLLPLARTAGADPGLGIPACTEEPGWYSLYDATQETMVKYWFNSSPQNHGINSRWWIENGILNSGQDNNGGGGCIFTKHQYTNVELKVLTKPHFGNDAGLFFRSNSAGRSYQVVIDYKAQKSVAGIYLEGISGPDHKGFYFGGSETAPISLSANWFLNGTNGRAKMTAADWSTKIWKLNDFNWITGKIYHDEVPFMDTFINGFQIVHYENPLSIAQTVNPQRGYLALQVHNGSGAWVKDSYNQYKAVLVRELQGSGQPLASYPEWSSKCGTGAAKQSMASAVAPTVSWKLESGKAMKIEGTSAENYVLTLTDVNGKSVYRARGKAGRFQHSVGVKTPGIHMLTIRTNRHTQTHRLIQSNG